MMSLHKVQLEGTQAENGLGSIVRALVISALLYAMALEWFRPLLAMSERTEVHMRMPFYVAFALYLLPEIFRIPPLFGWLFRIGVTFCIVISLFFEPLQGLGWVSEYMNIVLDDIRYVLQGEYYWVGAENRTLLFLTGWMMLLSSVQSLILHRKKALWLVAASAAYLAGMQWWLSLNTGLGLIRVIAIGLVLAALVRLPELEHRFGTLRRGWPAAWVAATGIVAAVSVGAGWGLAQPHPALPEQQPSLPQAMERIASLWGGSGPFAAPASYRNASISRTGYGDSDFQLGGPVIPDESIAFIARTDKPAYWRGEAKTLYDGKGWIQVERDSISGILGEDLPLLGANSSSEDDRQGETIGQEIWLKDQRLGRVLFASGLVQRVDAAMNEKGDELQRSTIRYYPGSGKLQLESADSPLMYYRLTSKLPYDSNQLAAAITDTENDPASLRGALSQVSLDTKNFQNELRLPVALPDRVKELGMKLAAEHSEPLLQAKAIETYLRENYTYSLEQPTYPQQGQDFTDHFLFVEKVGYCDHFSTSMAVLLRAAGIPSRWVKGFAPGEAVPNPTTPELSASTALSDSTGDYTVVVRNKHAHSWVEAYIAPYGWVPFEPTPGFAGATRELPDSSGLGLSISASNISVTDAVLGSGTFSPALGPQLDNPAYASGENALAGRQLVLDNSSWTEALQSLIAWKESISFGSWRHWLYALASLLGVAGLLIILSPALRKPSQQPYRSNGSRSIRSVRLTGAMDQIWRQLFRKYGAIGLNQTPREYASAIAERFAFTPAQRSRMHEFVELYERVRYSSDIPRELSLRRIASIRKQLHDTLSTRHEPS
jgi:transglutaminase-like putative cysteine protease